MNLLNHPAFQSLVLPLLLSVLGVALALRVGGPHRAALGASLGLLVAWSVFPGYVWPASARAQQVLWIALAGALVAVLLLWRTPRVAAPRGRGILMAGLLTVACLALAAAAALGGSLLLAQLAMMVATASAVPGLWSWWRPASGVVVSAVSLLPMALACLVIATALPAAPWNATPGDAGIEDPYYAPKWK